MAKNEHGYVSTMRCECMDVDALNRVGIYNSGDLDNGVLVTLDKMVQDGNGVVNGFEYEVALATSTSVGVWVVATPEVGATPAMQEDPDPRAFYNLKGRPMSIKKLIPDIDELEVSKGCFVDTTLPTTTNKYITIGANGKMQATSSAPGSKGGYFELVGLHSIAVGWEEMPTAIIRYKEYEA